MTFNYNAFLGYIEETENELLRIGAVRCNALNEKTQLAAVIMLLLRGCSLLRAVLNNLATSEIDACDALRRAYLESWYLAYDLRLTNSATRAISWHDGGFKSWSAKIKKIQQHSESRGSKDTELGKIYSNLSAIAHPSQPAAENSVVIVTARHGSPEAQENLVRAREHFENKDIPELMYRFLWLVLDEGDGLIPLGLNESQLPTAFRYAEEYVRINQLPTNLGVTSSDE